MFSGLTNQVSSWMGGTGKKDGEAPKEDEKLASPVADTQSGNNTEGDKKDSSPTKGGGGRFDMLTNVKSQMSGWLSAGVPGLRRGDDENVDAAVAAVTGETKTDVESPASEKSVKGSPVEQQKEEDDNSSATGGADSDVAASEPGTPGEDKDVNALGGVSTKAIQGAKSIGNFLFSAVNKAGKTVSEASAKIKKTVEENSLLGEFNKEQEAFIKEKQGKNSEAAVPPWVGCPNEESLKEECLTLSTDRRNFVRSPPAGVDFQFDYEVSYPIAMATLAEDPNLEKMRFELVPKVINEETFWRNYFYRVSLIRQANELSSMAQEGQSEPGSRANSTEVEPAAKPSHHHNLDALDQGPTDSPTHEFVSDNFRASSKDIEEVREGMKKLGMDPDKRNEEEWEKELEAELQDYEVVTDGDGNAHQDSSNWENQIQEMLDAEDPTDLK